MSNANILMIGNCVLDDVWSLDHYPAEDEELRAEKRRLNLGGNACNSAQILAQLGDQVDFAGVLAKDESAHWMFEQLAQLGIATRFCKQLEHGQSPTSVIWLNRQNGSRTIVHHRDLPELSVADLLAIESQHLQWAHLEGRNIENLLAALPAMQLACPVSLEIEKPRAHIEKLLPLVDVAIVSKAYLRARAIDARECIEQFQRINPALEIICTLGAQGVEAANRRDSFKLAAQPVENVIDSLGAGDCFIAGFIHQRLQSDNFRQAVQFANRLAADKIQRRGMNIDV